MGVQGMYSTIMERVNGETISIGGPWPRRTTTLYINMSFF